MSVTRQGLVKNFEYLDLDLISFLALVVALATTLALNYDPHWYSRYTSETIQISGPHPHEQYNTTFFLSS